MALAQFRTDFRLWWICAGCAFVALGFVDPVAGAAKGDNCMWSYIGARLDGESLWSIDEMLVPIVFWAVLQAVPAALVGWVAQALLVVLWSLIRGRPSASGGIRQGRVKAP